MSDEQTGSVSTGLPITENGGAGPTIDLVQAEAVEQVSNAPGKEGEAEGSKTGEQKSILTEDEAGDPSGDQTGETPEETKPTARAPEEYDDFSVPEGMKLEGEELTEFKSFAKEQDLTQEQAQRVLDFAGPKIKAMIEQPYKAWKEMTQQWWNATKADAEVGGTRLEQSVKDAGQAFVPSDSNPFFKTQSEVQAIREALRLTGAMHHPEVQRLFVRMGRLLAEPSHLTGKPASQDKQQAFLNSMYPTMMEGGS